MDRFRLVTIDPRLGKAYLADDLNRAGTVFRERDTFEFTPAQRRDRSVSGDRRYQGSRIVGTAHDFATVKTGLIAEGDTSDHALERVERVLELADRLGARGDLYVEWGPAGGRTDYFEIRGPATVTHAYNPRAFEQASMHRFTVAWPVAPLPEGLPMTVVEDFTQPGPDDPDDVVNLLPNPSPEVDLSFTTAGGNTTLSRVNNAALIPVAGLFEWRLTPTAAGDVAMLLAGDGPGGRFPLAHPDRPVWVAPYARLGGSATPRTLYCKIAWFDGTGTALPEENQTATLDQTAAFTRYPLKFDPPANAESFDVELQGLAMSGPGQITVFSDIGIFNAIELPDYGDGDMPGYRWAGAPFGSRSVKLSDGALDEFVLDSDPAKIGVRTDPTLSQIAPNGIKVRVANQLTVMRHTRYEVTDFVASVKLWTAGAGGTNIWAIGKDVGGKRVVARLTTGGSLEVLDDGTQRASAALPALSSNKAYWLVFRCVGRMVRAELWDREPQLGGSAETGGTVTATNWTHARHTAELQWAMDSAGYPVVQFQTASMTPRLLEVAIRPYHFLLPQGPASVVLRGVPGTAPAKIDVAVGASSAEASAVPFALLAWRRHRRHNMAIMGDREAGYGAWFSSAVAGILNAGGTITARDNDDGPIAVAPDNRAPAVQITVNPGVATAGGFIYVPQRIRRGEIYTVEFIYKVVSGAWEFRAFGDGTNEVDESGTSVAVALASANHVKVTQTFVATAHRGNLRAMFRTTSAAAADIRVFGLRVYPGRAPGPREIGQTDDRGGLPPFGLLLAENDVPAKRVGFTLEQSGSIAPNGWQLTFALGTTARAEWVIDPDMLDVPEGSTGELDVEIWALYQLRGDTLDPRAVVSVAPLQTAGPRVYTRDFGAAGRSLVNAPSSAGADVRASRLGSLTLSRDGRPAGRMLLRAEFAFGAGSPAGNFKLYYLVLAPLHARASTPTGKVNDSSYPVFWPVQAGLPAKLITSELRGYNTPAGPAAAAKDSGLGGVPIEVEPGDSELLAWIQRVQVPDDPVKNALGAAADVSGVGLEARVTPRYRLART